MVDGPSHWSRPGRRSGLGRSAPGALCFSPSRARSLASARRPIVRRSPTQAIGDRLHRDREAPSDRTTATAMTRRDRCAGGADAIWRAMAEIDQRAGRRRAASGEPVTEARSPRATTICSAATRRPTSSSPRRRRSARRRLRPRLPGTTSRTGTARTASSVRGRAVDRRPAADAGSTGRQRATRSPPAHDPGDRQASASRRSPIVGGVRHARLVDAGFAAARCTSADHGPPAPRTTCPIGVDRPASVSDPSVRRRSPRRSGQADIEAFRRPPRLRRADRGRLGALRRRSIRRHARCGRSPGTATTSSVRSRTTVDDGESARHRAAASLDRGDLDAAATGAGGASPRR